jgi:hypothetical protein
LTKKSNFDLPFVVRGGGGGGSAVLLLDGAVVHLVGEPLEHVVHGALGQQTVVVEAGGVVVEALELGVELQALLLGAARRLVLLVLVVFVLLAARLRRLVLAEGGGRRRRLVAAVVADGAAAGGQVAVLARRRVRVAVVARHRKVLGALVQLGRGRFAL